MSIHLPTGRDVEEWQLAVWNAADAVLSRPQKLVLMLMLDASFNSFDAFRVVRDLLTHRHLWHGVVMSRGLDSDLIALRDLPDGYWNVDTVFITHEPAHAHALTALVENWSADEIFTYNGDNSGDILGTSDDDCLVLRAWWD